MRMVWLAQLELALMSELVQLTLLASVLVLTSELVRSTLLASVLELELALMSELA